MSASVAPVNPKLAMREADFLKLDIQTIQFRRSSGLARELDKCQRKGSSLQEVQTKVGEFRLLVRLARLCSRLSTKHIISARKKCKTSVINSLRNLAMGNMIWQDSKLAF